MCGRYSLRSNVVPVRFQEVGIDWTGAPRFNVAPGQRAPVIRNLDNQIKWTELRWGWLPRSTEKIGVGVRVINARAETVNSKPLFRSAFRHRRCLIPADGFYEWKAEGRTRLPWRFVRRDGGPLLFAGLWELSRSSSTPEVFEETFIILTTRPNAVTSAIHDRMPVVLSEESADQWLDPNSGALGLEWLCLPLPDEALLRYRVGLAVNSVHSNSEACLRPAPEQTEWEF